MSISSSTVRDCLRRANLANLSWPLPDDLSNDALEQKLYPATKSKIVVTERGDLDLPKIHEELKRKHVTLILLWDEYRELHPTGLSYSQFCPV